MKKITATAKGVGGGGSVPPPPPSPGDQSQGTDAAQEEGTGWPFVMTRRQDRGRCLVASRDISAGELVLEERALVVGPRITDDENENNGICVGCFFPTASSANKRGACCPVCGLRLCEEACQRSSQFHRLECGHLAKVRRENKGGSFSSTGLVTLLRAALLRDSDPAAYGTVLGFQGHREEKEKDRPEEWAAIARQARRAKEMYNLDHEVSELEDLVCILKCNSYLALSRGGSLEPMCGLYAAPAMINHSCRPNTRPAVAADYTMRVVAAEDIPKGREITTSYLDSFHTTLQRRSILRRGKHFDCSCQRCSDPTELGSFSSAVACRSCGEGYLLPEDPLDPESRWVCGKIRSGCGAAIDGGAANALDAQLVRETEKLEGGNQVAGTACVEKFLATYSKFLHPNHAFLSRLKQMLCEGYGRFGKMSPAQWERKRQVCSELLFALSLTEAHMSMARVVVSLELADALTHLVPAEEDAKVQAEAVGAASRLVDFSESALRHEDPRSPEGAVLARAAEIRGRVGRLTRGPTAANNSQAK